MANGIAFEDSIEEREKKQILFITLLIYAVVITDIIRLVSSVTHVSMISNLVEPLRNILYIFIFLGYYNYSTKRERTTGIISVILYIIVLTFSLLLNPEIQGYSVNLTLMFISRFLLAFVMISQLKYPRMLIRETFRFSWIIPIYVLLYAISPKDLSTGYAYSITFSYNLLLPAVASFYCFYVLKEKKIYALVISIIAIIGMIVYGSRGTIVCVGTAVIYILFFNRNTYSTKKFVIIIGGTIIAFSILFAKDSILSTLTYLLPNSRSLYLIQNSNFLWDSNRNNYFDMASRFLQDTPLKVTGLAGDVFVYGNKFGLGVELGRHSHNIFVELIVSYGIILGGMACTIVVIKLLSTIVKSRWNSDIKDMCAFIIIPLLPFTLISGSLCQSYQHWLLLGGAFSILNRQLSKKRI